MNKILFTALASVGVLALVSCADDSTTTRTNSNYSSTTMSSDPKNMSGDTMTRSTVVPAPVTDTNTVTDPNAIPYPAIHSNGQHF